MKVAVVGLGQMGTAIAERLLAAGHEVVVHNRTTGKAEALIADGAREVPRAEVWPNADVVITMLADSPALEQTLLGDDGLAQSADASGKTLIDMSTVSVAASTKVAAAAEKSGIAYLRAPVSGNPMVVRGGGLGIVVTGDKQAFEANEALLGDIGPNIFYLGEGEGARIMKLALNLMVAGTAALLAESIALGEANGLDRSQMLEVISGSAVGSPFIKYKTAALVANDYSSTFSTKLMHKDLNMALASASESGLPGLPTTATVQELLDQTIAAGMGDIDFMALLPRLQQEAGQDISAIVSA